MKKERGIGNEAVMNEVRRLAEVRWASGLSGDKSQLMLEASSVGEVSFIQGQGEDVGEAL